MRIELGLAFCTDCWHCSVAGKVHGQTFKYRTHVGRVLEFRNCNSSYCDYYRQQAAPFELAGINKLFPLTSESLV